MINSVSAIPFRASAMDRVSQEQLYSPGAYSQPAYAYQEPQRKSGGFFSFLGKLILTAAIVGGGAVAARKFISPLKKEALDVSEKLADGATFGAKIKYHIAKAADFVEDKSVGLYNKVFKKNKVEEK